MTEKQKEEKGFSTLSKVLAREAVNKQLLQQKIIYSKSTMCDNFAVAKYSLF